MSSIGQGNLNDNSVWRQLVKYSAPLVLSNILQALYGMVDMIVAGVYIGSTGLSAINNASQITILITQIIIGLTTGGNVLIGQYFGGGDKENLKQTTVTLFSSSLIVGLVFSVIFYFSSQSLLVFLRAPALEEATDYLQVCSIGIFFIMGYNALRAALIAVGNSKSPLYYIAVTTALNLVLDILFMGKMGMGTAGAALATTISQGISFVLVLIRVLRDKEIFGLSLKKLYIRKAKALHILKIGIPSAIQMSIAGISWLSVTYIVNDYGLAVSAGVGVAVKIKDFCQLFTSAMASGATAMIAQSLGASKYDKAKKIMYTAMKITVVMSLVLIVIVQLFAYNLAGIFTDDTATINAAVQNLRIEIWGQVFYAMFLIYHALAIGAGDTLFAFGSSFVNCIIVRMVLAFTLNHFFGLTGLFVACLIAPSASVPLGMIYTRSNVWRKTLTEN